MEKCQRCGEEGSDRRTLWMKCFYQMSEMPVPFKVVTINENVFYTLRVCKECRGLWMAAIEEWFRNVTTKENINSGIFVRKNGATVEVTAEEFERRRKEVK